MNLKLVSLHVNCTSCIKTLNRTMNLAYLPSYQILIPKVQNVNSTSCIITLNRTMNLAYLPSYQILIPKSTNTSNKRELKFVPGNLILKTFFWPALTLEYT